jgi:hypothetical protein
MARSNIVLTGYGTNLHGPSSDSLQTKLNEHDTALDGANAGVIPAARLNFATNPSNTNTVTINGHVFKFLTTPIAADTTTQIVIGADAAASLALLVKAINGTADVLIIPATTPHTLTLLADAVTATKLRIRKAATAGGAVATGDKLTSYAVSETLANANDVWDRANFNSTGATANAATARGTIAITAQMITALTATVELPFTPLSYGYCRMTSTGTTLTCTDTVAISGNALLITMAGGATPNLQAGDIVSFWASA